MLPVSSLRADAPSPASELAGHLRAQCPPDEIAVSAVPDAPPAAARIHVVQARSLAAAESAAARLRARMPPPRTFAPARAANLAPPPVAAALLGVMVTAPGDWSRLVASPVAAAAPDALGVPRQSWQADGDEGEELVLAGFVAWEGDGLVRCDGRKALAERHCAPGEGFLRLDQLASEMLAKTGVIQKYGS